MRAHVNIYVRMNGCVSCIITPSVLHGYGSCASNFTPTINYTLQIQSTLHIQFSATHTKCLATIGWQLEKMSCDDWCYMTSYEDRYNKHVTPGF